MRGTRLEVNLANLKNNLKEIQNKTAKNVKTIAIVKADSYGLGSVKVSNYIKDSVWAFGVATVEEAIELRENNITDKPIIMLSPFLENEIDEILSFNITPTVVDLKRAQLLNKKIKNRKLNVHIKIDTGMGRIGLPYDESTDEITKICELDNLNIEGLYTHFPSADLLDEEFCDEQISRFNNFNTQLEDKGIKIPIKHMANSSAIVAFPQSHKEAIRPGILMYGTYPSKMIKEIFPVKSVAKFISKILLTKNIKPGETVSYGRTFVAQRDTRVAVLGVGYADGYSTLNSSKSFVYINGNFAPVLGRVCMDYTVVDITNIPEAKIGDDAVLFGEGGDTVEYYASKIGIISYEALTSVGKRVPRIYV